MWGKVARRGGDLIPQSLLPSERYRLRLALLLGQQDGECSETQQDKGAWPNIQSRESIPGHKPGVSGPSVCHRPTRNESSSPVHSEESLNRQPCLPRNSF